MLDGRSLIFNGLEIVKAVEPVNYFAARRVREDLIIETDASGLLVVASLGARRLIWNGKDFDVTGAVLNFRGGALINHTDESARVETFA